jgi:CDP-glycerol glycerophosphotransferase
MRLPWRRRPLLSVVVPAYNVEEYVEESLASVLGQSYPELEVVVVDDGSTDGTGDIVDRIAAGDRRVRVIRQANAGLGAARNTGVRHARGDLLAFADSDDLVVEGAYERLVGALAESGSALAIGAVERFEGDRVVAGPLMKENHARAAYGVTLADQPLILADVFAWNKVYRRSFWDATGLDFPVGVRYEDQPTLTRALLAAPSFDVLTAPVYRWRIRSDGSSISQQRADIRDLSDRILTKRWSTETLIEHGSDRLRQVWFARVLPIDMWEYFRSVPGCSDDYWSMLRDGVREFWGAHTVPFERTGLPLRRRIMGWLVAEDLRSELEGFLDYLDELDGPLPRRVVDGQELVDHPLRDHPGLPPELLRP